MSETLQWRCISGCGSCCRLDPGERNEALEALSPEQQQQYLEMVGPDGWCIHYDTGSSSCRIYDERPFFCRVENLAGLFGVGTTHAYVLHPASGKPGDQVESPHHKGAGLPPPHERGGGGLV